MVGPVSGSRAFAGKRGKRNPKTAEQQPGKLDKQPIIITSALTYSNGPLHIGHILEYIQTDIIARALKSSGKEVIYCGGEDTHGTPIEISAMRLGISPEQLITRFFKEHKEDLDAFFVQPDSFYSTHSSENKELVDFVFNTLRKNGHIYKKDVELTYCPKCSRFLPDRFVKGTCPRCGAADQYGDVCEVCGSSYAPIELKEPYCAICHSAPTRKVSKHYFFKLSSFSDQLADWLTSNKALQPEIKNHVLRWIESGLQDWDISRDGPYFGFKIPGEENKYYYVWMDAPIGYISSLAHWFKGDLRKAIEYWNNAYILHIIGKDIFYFHFLFWPAMLMAAGLRKPDSILVHGFVTINGEKMSKSKGTFLTAKDALKIAKPEYFRWYFASHLGRTLADVDLNLTEFKEKINSDLVSNIANFCYRVLSFVNSHLDSKLGHIDPVDKDVCEASLEIIKKIKTAYLNFEIKEAVKGLLELSSLGNAYFQKNAPWKLIKGGVNEKIRAKSVVTLATNIVKNIAILSYPILPSFSASIEAQLRLKNLNFSDTGFNLEDRSIGTAKAVFTKLVDIRLTAEEPFSKLELRVGKIIEAKVHPNAEKLLVLQVDLGSVGKRQLVAGIRQWYTPEELVGKKVLVLVNLKPIKLRGVESQGMILAAKRGTDTRLVEAKSSEPGDIVFVDGVEQKPEKQIKIEQFADVKLVTRNKKVFYYDKPLKTKKEELISDIGDDAVIS
ncbi:MAG: methionine--tRNA ligase [Candidatus Woesearchaeota archaeon]